MATVSQTVEVDEDTAAAMLGPRNDLLAERAWTDDDEADWAGRDPASASGDDRPAPDGDGRRATYALARGPMLAYRRDVSARPAGDGRVEVTETTRFRLALGVWSAVVVLPIKRALQSTSDRTRPRSPVWAPPDQLDTRAGTILGLLLTLSIVQGYLGTVLTQSMYKAANEFDASETAQGTALSAVRIGTLGSLVLVGLSDRHGRRRLLLGSMTLACLFTVAGAFAPSLEVLAVTQTFSRSCTTAAALLFVVVTAEEMPAGGRAYAVSVLTMTGALGAGIGVWVLPLSIRFIGERGWRVVFLLPVLALPIMAWARNRLPESKRFERPHRAARVLKGHGARLAIIGAALFCTSAIGTPASQFLNDFLEDERGFSEDRIAIFTILTSTPAGLALLAGGRLAETAGRRRIIAIGIAGGSIVGALSFALAGWPLWVGNLAATMLAALAGPALGTYGPELFPTAARGKANGVIQVMSVSGSALGLLIAGRIVDRTDQLFDAMVVLLPFGLLVAILALTVFPETAHRELEEINPEDDLTLPGEGAVIVPHVDAGPAEARVTDRP